MQTRIGFTSTISVLNLTFHCPLDARFATVFQSFGTPTHIIHWINRQFSVEYLTKAFRTCISKSHFVSFEMNFGPLQIV